MSANQVADLEHLRKHVRVRCPACTTLLALPQGTTKFKCAVCSTVAMIPSNSPAESKPPPSQSPWTDHRSAGGGLPSYNAATGGTSGYSPGLHDSLASAASGEVEQPTWMDQNDIPACFLCATEFTVVTRKHHCRCCGGVVCGKCSMDKMAIPGVNKDSVRVCIPCKQHLTDSPNGSLCLIRSCNNIHAKGAAPSAVASACRSLADGMQAGLKQMEADGVLARVLDSLIPVSRGVELQIQQQSVRALANLCSVEKFRGQTMEAGVVPIFIDLLSSDHDALRLQAARGVAFLSGEEAVRQTLIEMRGVATIVNVLPVESDEGQSVMVSIIEALANAGTQYRVMIREQHGIFTLAALLTTKNRVVLEKTTNILAMMVSDHQSRRAIFESGALTAMLSAVAHSGKIRHNALRVISTVTSDHAVCNQLAERDIARLASLLEDTSNVQQLQMVTATIRNAAAADERFARSLANAGCVQLMLQLMQKNGPEGWAAIRTDALNFLLASCTLDVVRDALIQGQGVAVLATIASSPSSHIAEVEVCLTLLSTLTAFSERCRKALFEIGGTSLMLDCIMNTGASQPRGGDIAGITNEEQLLLMQNAKTGPALQVLANLCEDQDVWDVIADARGEVAVLKYAGSSDQNISLSALRCLVALARSSDPRSRDLLLKDDVVPALVGHLAARDESTAEMSAEIISELCSDRRCRDELLRQDSVQKLLRMLSSSQNATLRAKAAVAIGGVAGDERFWQVITQSNGLAMMVELLFNPNTPASVKLSVCTAVADLVTDRNHALSFQRAGGAHALTSVVGLRDEKAAAAAAYALGNLAKAIDAANVQVDDTTVRRLVAMLDEPGAVSAMHALTILCDDEPVRQRFIQSGVESALVHASKSHADSEARQRAMQVLVRVLREGDDGGQRLVELGGVPMLLGMASSGRVEDKESALEQLEQISSNLSSLDGQERALLPTLVQSMQSNLSQVRIKAINVLINVTRDERVAPFAVGAGAVGAMLKHHDRKNQAELDGVVKVLCNLSWLDALHEMVVQASFLPNLVSLLSSTRTQTQESAATVVSDLSTRRQLLPHLVKAGALMPVVGLLARGNGILVERGIKTLSNIVCVPEAAKELQKQGRLDCVIPLLSVGSTAIQSSAVLAVGALVGSVGERQRFLQNGAVERLAQMLVLGQVRHDSVLYALGELCEDETVCERMAKKENPWGQARAWLVKNVQAMGSELDLRRRCAFVLRKMASVKTSAAKLAMVESGALNCSIDLLQQQEDGTLCVDLSVMLYELATCQAGLDIICTQPNVKIIVGLFNHSHEPTRACAVRLLGLVVARGGVQWVLSAGGHDAVRTVGMLAATNAKEVAAVSRARAAVEALVPLKIDGTAAVTQHDSLTSPTEVVDASPMAQYEARSATAGAVPMATAIASPGATMVAQPGSNGIATAAPVALGTAQDDNVPMAMAAPVESEPVDPWGQGPPPQQPWVNEQQPQSAPPPPSPQHWNQQPPSQPGPTHPQGFTPQPTQPSGSQQFGQPQAQPYQQQPTQQRPAETQPQPQPQYQQQVAQPAQPFQQQTSQEAFQQQPQQQTAQPTPPAPTQPQPQQQQRPRPLWKEYTSPDGRKYYYNTSTKVTTWNRPPEMDQPQPQQPPPPPEPQQATQVQYHPQQVQQGQPQQAPQQQPQGFPQQQPQNVQQQQAGQQQPDQQQAPQPYQQQPQQQAQQYQQQVQQPQYQQQPPAQAPPVQAASVQVPAPQPEQPQQPTYQPQQQQQQQQTYQTPPQQQQAVQPPPQQQQPLVQPPPQVAPQQSQEVAQQQPQQPQQQPAYHQQTPQIQQQAAAPPPPPVQQAAHPQPPPSPQVELQPQVMVPPPQQPTVQQQPQVMAPPPQPPTAQQQPQPELQPHVMVHSPSPQASVQQLPQPEVIVPSPQPTVQQQPPVMVPSPQPTVQQQPPVMVPSPQPTVQQQPPVMVPSPQPTVQQQQQQPELQPQVMMPSPSPSPQASVQQPSAPPPQQISQQMTAQQPLPPPEPLPPAAEQTTPPPPQTQQQPATVVPPPVQQQPQQPVAQVPVQQAPTVAPPQAEQPAPLVQQQPQQPQPLVVPAEDVVQQAAQQLENQLADEPRSSESSVMDAPPMDDCEPTAPPDSASASVSSAPTAPMAPPLSGCTSPSPSSLTAPPVDQMDVQDLSAPPPGSMMAQVSRAPPPPYAAGGEGSGGGADAPPMPEEE